MEDLSSENIFVKKPKLPNQDTTIEISDDELNLENSCELKMQDRKETDNKISSLDSLPHSQCSDSGIEALSYNSQGSLELSRHIHDTTAVDKRLLELEDEVQQLRTENESLKLCTCQCKQIRDKAIITVTFNNLDNFRMYKTKILNAFNSCLNVEVKEHETDLLLSIFKDDSINTDDWVVIDETDCVAALTPDDKRKKKKKRKCSVTLSDPLDIFMVDTTPSFSTKNNLQYERKFDFVNTPEVNNEKVRTPKMGSVCFNCEENHNLKDCPKPRNYSKINALRQKMKMQSKTNMYRRYHLEDDQVYGHLQPGKISDKLQDALGIRPNQLPEYIYRMRQLGYPPGWYNEIVSLQDSNLVLFDFNGRDASKLKKNVQHLDINRVIDYHGFNVPLQKGYKDEHRVYRCAPYSEESSKEKMIEHLLSLRKEPVENLESCDMEIDNNPSDKEIEHFIKTSSTKNMLDTTSQSTSPTLTELETAKKELLAQLTEDVSDFQEEVKNSNDDVCVTITELETAKKDLLVQLTEDVSDSQEEVKNCNDDVCVTVSSIEVLDVPTNCTDANSPQEMLNNSVDLDTTADLSKLNTVRRSSFGTPILKSGSPFSQLPKSENFTKDVSDIINFENLPNSTGKYDQMVGVLEKVRTTLKQLNDKLS